MGVTAKKDSSKVAVAKSAAKKTGATAATVKTPKATTATLKPKPASRAATPARKTAAVKTAPAAQPKAGKAVPEKATTSSAANVVVVKSLTVKKTVSATAGSGTKKGVGKAVGAASQKAPATASTPAAREVDSKATKSGQAGGSKASGSKAAKQDAKQDASAGLKDKIEKPVVLKVSEVATKTPKTTPDTQTLLTEEQILKMGEKDYMNEAQLAFFKARLQQLERDLLKNAGETTEHLRETVLVPDPADRATIEEEHALELRTRDRERKLLKKVQQSIVSIDAGEYGWCEETGEPIGIPRLLARPTATLSLEAQQRRELKQKLYGD